MGKPKFYGVARGRAPGVYATWDEARAQVDGIKGAVHKSFSTREEAARWVSARNPDISGTMMTGEARPSAGVQDRASARSPPTSPGKPRAPRSASSMGGARALSTSARDGGDPIAAAEGANGKEDEARQNDADAAPPPTAPLADGSYTLYFDGASRGNPGPAGAGALIRRDADSRVVFEIAEYLGDDKTNNEAEYIALVGGLRKAAQLGIRVLNVKGDSSLVVNQVNGTWKVKTDHLRPMFEEARRIIDENFDGGASIAYVRRELNSEADSLANVAITVGSQIGAGVNVAPGADDGAASGAGFGGGSGGGTARGTARAQSMRPTDPWWGAGKVRGVHVAAGHKRERGGGVRVRATPAPVVVDLTAPSDDDDETGTGPGSAFGGPAFASLTASSFAYPARCCGGGSRSWRWPSPAAAPSHNVVAGSEARGCIGPASRLRRSVAVAVPGATHAPSHNVVAGASRASSSAAAAAARRWLPILRGSVRWMSRLVA
jgi:ribonuclease HI